MLESDLSRSSDALGDPDLLPPPEEVAALETAPGEVQAGGRRVELSLKAFAGQRLTARHQIITVLYYVFNISTARD